MRKRLGLPIIALAIWLMTVTVCAYSVTDETTLASGVTHYSTKRFDGETWYNINVVEIDLKHENLTLHLLKQDSSNTLETVEKLAEKHNALAAVNGDFFQWNSLNKRQGAALGLEVEDNQLISSPTAPKQGMQTAIYNDEVLYFTYVAANFNVIAPNGEMFYVEKVNKYEVYSYVCMFTSIWNNGMSNGSWNDVVEMVVEDDIVTDIRLNAEAVPIPENGYILSLDTKLATFLTDNFQVGDPVQIVYDCDPALSGIRASVGGGALVLQNGEVPSKFSHVLAGEHPRTAIGVDETGTVVYLVTVDGRQKYATGMRMSTLGELMKSIGCYNAMNLDGGGSTQMALFSEYDQSYATVNKPSEALRPVVNAFAVLNQSDNIPHAISIESSMEHISVGDRVYLRTMLVDQYLNKCDPQPEVFTYEVSNGHMEGAVYIPQTHGEAVITVTHEDMTATLELTIQPSVDDDPQNNLQSPLFAIGTDYAQQNTLFKIVMSGKISQQLSQQAENVFIYNTDKVKDYSSYEIGGTTFLTLQPTVVAGWGWNWLTEKITQSPDRNLVIMLKSSFSAVDSEQWAMLLRMIYDHKIKQGRDAILICPGSETAVEINGGIRCISIGHAPTEGSILQRIAATQMLLIGEADGRLNYEISNLQ